MRDSYTRGMVVGEGGRSSGVLLYITSYNLVMIGVELRAQG